jgi:hypothetical protein
MCGRLDSNEHLRGSKPRVLPLDYSYGYIVLFAQKVQANKAGCKTSHGKKQRHVTLNTDKKKK